MRDWEVERERGEFIPKMTLIKTFIDLFNKYYLVSSTEITADEIWGIWHKSSC